MNLKMSNKRLKLALLYCAFPFLSFAQSNDFVKVNTTHIISDNFIGHGVEWSAYPHADSDRAEWGLLMTDEKWQKVFSRLDYMQPKIVRVLDQANWRYLEGVDANGNLIINYNNQEMSALYKLLDYCQKNNIKVILGEWGQPYKVHDTHLKLDHVFSGTNDPKWLHSITDFLHHLIKVKGYTCIQYYNLVNEPNGYWASVDGNWDEWKSGIIQLNELIKQRGLSQNLSIIGPDSTPYNNEKSPYKGLEWPRQAAIQLSDVIGAYDVHDYPTKEFVRSGEFQKQYTSLVKFTEQLSKKPFIFGEIGFEKYVPENIKRYEADPFASEDSQLSIYDYDYGVDMADVLVQSMNSGVDAVLAWGLDDAMHTNGDKGEKHQLKKWGMWNILGEELTGDAKEENIRPWFYTWSLMTRFYTGDMKIVKTDGISQDKPIRAVTGINDKGDMTFTLVNNSSEEYQFYMDQDAVKGKTFRKYLYSENQMKKDKNDFPVSITNKFKVKSKTLIKVPAKSVLLFTTYQF